LREMHAHAGYTTSTLMLHREIISGSGRDRLRNAMEEADIVVLSAPLYVDSLPSNVMRWMQWVVDEGIARDRPNPPRLVVIVQCGYPGKDNNRVAVDICRLFARDAGWHWSGGLSMGMGGIINGHARLGVRPLIRNQLKALDRSAQVLAGGGDVPAQAMASMGRSPLPSGLYVLLARYNLRWRALRAGTLGRLSDRPYLSDTG
jgi:hypothetical protein